MTAVARDVEVWRTTINGVHHSFDVPYAHSISPKDSAPPALNLNGIGEGMFSAAVTPAMIPNVLSPVLPLRDPRLEITAANIERIASEVPELMARRAASLCQDGNATVDLMARSQGGPVGIRAVVANQELYRRVGLIMPFGLNREELGSNPLERRRELLRRLARSAAQGNLLDRGNRYSAREISGYMSRALLQRKLFPALDAALTFDETDDLRNISETHPITVFFGEADGLFPQTEVEPHLPDSAAVVRLPGHHATPGSHIGQRQILTAYQHLRAA